MSARITFSIRRTPVSPCAATAHAQARPSSTARAPSASIFTTSSPMRTPPSASTSTSPPTASTIAGSARAVEGTESSWRPPWLETTIPSTPDSTARRASVGSSTPFTISLPSQCSRTHAMSSQVTLGSNCASTHSLNASGVLAPGTAFSRLPKVSGLPPSPTSRTQRGCERRSSARRARTHGCAAPTTALRVSRWRAPTTARSIVSTSTGEPDRPRPGHQVLRVAAVAHHVELEPRRLRSSPPRPPRSSRSRPSTRRTGCPTRCRCARRLRLGPRGEHAAEAHRPEDHRHRELLAERPRSPARGSLTSRSTTWRSSRRSRSPTLARIVASS